MIKPTTGRVVHFYEQGKTQYDAGEQPSAAIVSYIHSDTEINLAFFDCNGVSHSKTGVPLYQGEGERPDGAYAEWMPFQAGQAKATTQPAVGRIVHYQSYGTPGGEYLPSPRAAIITEVGDVNGTEMRVGLCVLNQSGMFFNADVAYAGNPTPGCWNWPPRE